MRSLRLAFVLLIVAGCSTPRSGPTTAASVTKGIAEPDRMAEAILKEVPPGTSIGEAEEFMEREGFKCRRYDSPTEAKPHLYCDRSDMVKFPVSRRWQVSVTYNQGKVAEVSANAGLVGP